MPKRKDPDQSPLEWIRALQAEGRPIIAPPPDPFRTHAKAQAESVKARAANAPNASQKAAFYALFVKYGCPKLPAFKKIVGELGGGLTTKKGCVFFSPPGGRTEDEWMDTAENVRTRCARLRKREKEKREHSTLCSR